MGWGRGYGTNWFWLLLLLICAGCGQDGYAPPVRDGKLVIDKDHADTVVPLTGGWEFYWGRILPPGVFHAANPPRADGIFQQPGRWHEFQRNGLPLGPFGFATFRLTVDPGPGQRDLGLSVPTMARAYRLWINGELASSKGEISADPEKERGTPSPAVVHLQSSGRPFEIVLQISNHLSKIPGANGAFYLGPYREVEQQRLAPMRRTLFLAGGLAMIAFYSLAVFAFRRSDRSQLYFGAFVLTWAAIFLIQYDGGFWLTLFTGPLSTTGLLRAEFILFYLSIPTAYAYFRALYPNAIAAAPLKIAIIASILISTGAALAPFAILIMTSRVAYLFIGALALYVAYKVVRATREQREDAVFVLASVGCLAVSGIVDMAIDAHLVPTAPMTMPVALCVFALLQALHMSHRSARNLRKIERLSAELDAKNQALEIKISETERLSRQIVSVSEEERSRISQELHDGICQQLTAARLRFSVLKKNLPGANPGELGELSRLLEGAVNQAYDMSLGLWPVETGTGGLATSFEELCRRTARSNGLTVSFRSNLPKCPSQSPDATRQLYRIAQEALTNVAKHAQARHVNVSVTCAPEHGMRLTVEDDGAGRAQAAGRTAGGGLGMRIMEHRAVMIGGRLKIEDRAGGGTVVGCTVPCPGSPNCPSAMERYNG